MPAQQRRGRDQKDRPTLPRQQLRQRSQHHPIRRRKARPRDLPAHHHQLMTQYRDLNVLGIGHRPQADQAHSAPKDQERQRANHHDR
jgi:hypothetical protein